MRMRYDGIMRYRRRGRRLWDVFVVFLQSAADICKRERSEGGGAVEGLFLHLAAL